MAVNIDIYFFTKNRFVLHEFIDDFPTHKGLFVNVSSLFVNYAFDVFLFKIIPVFWLEIFNFYQSNYHFILFYLSNLFVSYLSKL